MSPARMAFYHRAGPASATSGTGSFVLGMFFSCEAPEIEVTHVNLNDRTVEGMRHRTLPVFSVQYHPEAAPGPHDARHLFDEFLELAGA